MDFFEAGTSVSFLILVAKYSAFYMLGVILIVQFIHYPSFLAVSSNHFSEFHQRHSNWMSILVGPVMVLELLTGLLLVLKSPDPFFSMLTWVNLVLVILTWLSTFLISVPIHNRLAIQANQKDIQNLIKTNWLRTILWSAKAILLSVFL